MKKTAFIYIDQTNRDTLHSYIIGNILIEKFGFKVVYCNASDIIIKFFYFKPHIILMGNADIYHGDYIRLLSHFCDIVSMPTEQGIINETALIERILDGHNKHNKDYAPPAYENTKRIYLWGEYQFNALKKNTSSSIYKKLFITGCPRLTNFNIFERKIKKIDNSKTNIVLGIALEYELNDMNILDFMNRLKKNFFLWDEYGGSVDKFVWLNHRVTLSMIKLIDFILDNKKDFKIIVRTRMSDSMKNYHFINNRVSFDVSSNTHSLFDKSDILIVGTSSIGVESMIAGVPTFSIMGIEEEEYLKMGINIQNLNNYSKIKSFDDLNNLKVLCDDYLNKVNNKNFYEHISKCYYSPKYKNNKIIHPAYFIAMDINKIVKNSKSYSNFNFDERYVLLLKKCNVSRFSLIRKLMIFSLKSSLVYILFLIPYYFYKKIRTIMSFNIKNKINNLNDSKNVNKKSLDEIYKILKSKYYLV